MSATTNLSLATNKAFLPTAIKTEKYKACIDACNACIVSCKKVEKICAERVQKMPESERLAKECRIACTKAVNSMTADSKNAKADCLACAKACEKCAAECDKYKMADFKKCAADCRTAAMHCKEMK